MKQELWVSKESEQIQNELKKFESGEKQQPATNQAKKPQPTIIRRTLRVKKKGINEDLALVASN